MFLHGWGPPSCVCSQHLFSPMGSILQGQISQSQKEQLNTQVLGKRQDSGTRARLKVCAPSKKASVSPQSPPIDPCLHPSPASSWWLPWLPHHCWSCSGLAPPYCPSLAGMARLGETDQRKQDFMKNPPWEANTVESILSVAISVFIFGDELLRLSHFPSSWSTHFYIGG